MNEKFAWSDLYGIICLDWFDLSQMPKAHVSSYIVRALICICILYLLIAFSQMLTIDYDYIELFILLVNIIYLDIWETAIMTKQFKRTTFVFKRMILSEILFPK